MDDTKAKPCSCDFEHGTSRCHRKNTTLFEKNLDYRKIVDKDLPGTIAANAAEDSKHTTSKNQSLPVHEGTVKRGKENGCHASKSSDRGYHSICITNLNEKTTQADLKELVEPFGPFKKLYVGKDKETGKCNGLAYVHYKYREDAAKAISALNGYTYNYLILSVDWSERSRNNPNQ